MIDHITLHVSNAERSIAFYTKALSPLGYIPKAHHEPTIGFGVDDGTSFKKSRIYSIILFGTALRNHKLLLVFVIIPLENCCDVGLFLHYTHSRIFL